MRYQSWREKHKKGKSGSNEGPNPGGKERDKWWRYETRPTKSKIKKDKSKHKHKKRKIAEEVNYKARESSRLFEKRRE